MSTFQTPEIDSDAATSRKSCSIEDTITRVRCEFQEMPGLCVTAAQARRLWGLELHECMGVLGALEAAKYLRLTARGYIRA